MKKLLIFLIVIIILIDIIDNALLDNQITNFIKNTYFNKNYNIVINEKALNNNDKKYKEYSKIIHSTTNFYPKNKDEILNIYYTMLNNGLSDFSYYCDYSYSKCIDDIKELSNDANNFSYINQLIHPYYSFKEINSKYNYLSRRVDITIEKKYSNEDIKKIDNKINEISNNLNINSYNNVSDKIKVFHDYLANTNVYDKAKESKESIYNSDSAIGTLFEGYSVCSGYSDTMAIFLNKLGLENVKVITDKHAWNAVKLNNKWYHIDLTWDDPILSNGENIVTHDFLLITTDELLKKDVTEHNFDKNIYSFLYE